MTARERRADGGRLDPFRTQMVGVGERADAVGEGLGRIVGLARVQDFDGRVLKVV